MASCKLEVLKNHLHKQLTFFSCTRWGENNLRDYDNESLNPNGHARQEARSQDARDLHLLQTPYFFCYQQ